MRKSAAAEALYSQAVRNQSIYRLSNYLVRHHAKYLSGYLTVRSVISAWRSRLGRPLDGPDAFRLLLYLTRFASLEAIPDLSLPTDQFRTAVMERQVAWLVEIANAPVADLGRLSNSFFGSSQSLTYFRWTGGRLQEYPPDADLSSLTTQAIEEFGRQALASLRGQHASPGRVPNADSDLREILSVVKQSLDLASNDPLLLDASNVRTILNRQLILPIGHVDCLFWLVPQECRLTVQLRTELGVQLSRVNLRQLKGKRTG